MVLLCTAIGALAGYVKTARGSRIYGAVKGAFYGLLAGIFLHMAFSLADLLNRSYF